MVFKKKIEKKSIHVMLKLGVYKDIREMFTNRINNSFPSSFPAVNHCAELTIVQPVKRILDFRIIWQNLAKKNTRPKPA